IFTSCCQKLPPHINVCSGFTTPVPSDAICASPPPATTGVPSCNPVNSELRFVIFPITVPASFTFGEKARVRPHCSATQLSQALFCKSNIPDVHPFEESICS